MHRAQLIKAIFWELRSAGIPGTARDLIRMADFFVRSHAGEIAKPADYGRVIDSRALPLLPVDVVMNESPWKVLEFELSRNHHFDLDAPELSAARARINMLLGPEWFQSIPAV